jgi:hypothetical protein
MTTLMKPALVLGIAGALAFSAITPSEARGGRNAAAIGLGLAGAAIAGAAIASSRPYYGPGYYGGGYAYNPGYAYDSYAYSPGYAYEPAPVYVAPGYGYGYGYYGGYNSNYTGPMRERQLKGTDY